MIQRLRGRESFSRLRREGTRVRSGVLSVVMLPDPTAHPPRVGFAISRAVGPAVVRNRLRRQLRALARARADRWTPGSYLLIVAPAAAGATSGRLGNDLDAAIGQLVARSAR